MKTFNDSAGRTWTVSLTLDAAKRVNSLLGVNLLDLDGRTDKKPQEGGEDRPAELPLLTRLGTDIILLCDVIFAIIKPQADKAGVSDEEFGAALGGEVIFAAQTAFYEELVDFFRQLGRSDLARAIDAQRRMIELTVQGIETRIDGLDIEGEVDAILAGTPGGLSQNSPEPSASTTAP